MNCVAPINKTEEIGPMSVAPMGCTETALRRALSTRRSNRADCCTQGVHLNCVAPIQRDADRDVRRSCIRGMHSNHVTTRPKKSSAVPISMLHPRGALESRRAQLASPKHTAWTVASVGCTRVTSKHLPLPVRLLLSPPRARKSGPSRSAT